MAHQVFISYGHQDKLVADATCARLEARGIRCWIAPRDVLPGQVYGEAINSAIRGCRALVLVFSSSANLSEHVSKEVERAVSNGIPVVPLRIENVTPTGALEYFIGSVHWLDALTPPLEHHLERLAESVERLLGAEGKPRPIPPQQPAPPSARPSPSLGRYSALGAVVLLLIGGLWFVLHREPITNPPAAPVNPAPVVSAPQEIAPPIAGPAVQPARKQKDVLPLVARAPVAQSVPPAVTSAPPAVVSAPPAVVSAPPAVASTGIGGCWLFNNVNVRMEPDGRVTGFIQPGRWRAESASQYAIDWAPMVDTVQIGSDGRSLTGTSNYGIPVTGLRTSAGRGGSQTFVGVWQWNSVFTAIVSDGGAVSMGPFQGRWSSLGGPAYKVDWSTAPVDQLTLSSDGRTISGQNNFGFKVGGTRVACAN